MGNVGVRQMAESIHSFNVAAQLAEMARRMPDAAAVVLPAGKDRLGKRAYRTHSFAELDGDSDGIARGLIRLGVTPGTRLALMVQPGFDFISLVFAAFKCGAVAILIDPGMGRRRVLRCLDEASPQGWIAIPIVQAVRRLFSKRYAASRFNVTVGPRRARAMGAVTLEQLRRENCADEDDAPRDATPTSSSPSPYAANLTADDPAAIIFTTGSTGPPKGVLYRHGNFAHQVDAIRDRYGIEPGEIDVACFPLFALFNGAMGVTTVVPRMDFSRPARCDPRNIIHPINDLAATQSFASPAVWHRVGRYCQRHGIQLPTLRRVLSAGAPVPAEVLERIKERIHPDGDVHTPYGATEALPVATIAASEVLLETAAKTRQGAGVCVGRRFASVDWRVIPIIDGPIDSLDSLPEGPPAAEIGELIVRGPAMTREYYQRADANALGKVPDGDTVWHRMGDVGYLDGASRFWFCGRLAHRVLTAEGPMYTIPTEAIFNGHADVYRSALVGIGEPGGQTPVLIVEPERGRYPRGRAARRRLLDDLRHLAQSNERTRSIEHFLIHRSFPVDIRHNAKIFRERLAVWAARRIPGRCL